MWKEIPGFGGLYVATEDGRIRSTIEFIENPYRNHIRKQRNRHYGKDLVGKKLSAKAYKRINLSGKVYFSHRLIALTFIPNPDNLPQVNHKDGVKTNNAISNLEWVSNMENRQHAVLNNLVARRDNNCTSQKLTTSQCYKIVEMYNVGNMFQYEIAELYSVSQQTISKVVKTYGRN